jgi:hypothetical protein
MRGSDALGASRRKTHMPQSGVEELAVQLASMDRRQLVDVLRTIPCHFEMDFTDGFLQEISIERLRHITLAAILQAQRHGAAGE